MALINWGGQHHLEPFKEEVVIIVPDQPEIMAKLEEICDRFDSVKLRNRNGSTFLTMDANPGMGRRVYESMLGHDISRKLFAESPAGRFSLE